MRRLLLAAVTVIVAAANLSPAGAAVPGCATYSALAPYRKAEIGPDLVKANFAMSNWCSDAADVFNVALTLETKRCSFGVGCVWAQHDFRQFTSTPGSENGWELVSECRDGKNRYRLTWEIYGEGYTLLAAGGTSEPELTCDTDLPDCPVRPQIPLPGCGGVGPAKAWTLSGAIATS